MTRKQKKAEALLEPTLADVVEAFKHALSVDTPALVSHDLKTWRYQYYTSDSVVEVAVTKRPLEKGSDPREP